MPANTRLARHTGLLAGRASNSAGVLGKSLRWQLRSSFTVGQVRSSPLLSSALRFTQARKSSRLPARSAGFTMPELALSMVITGILLVSLFGFTAYYLAIATRNNVMAEMTFDSQNLLRIAVEELRYGAGVRQTSAISDPNAPAGGWNTSNSNFIIIIAVPAVNSSNQYIIDPLTGSPYNNELVYFKSGTTLFKRVLAHPSASGNSLSTSCPEALATSSCRADRRLMENLESMVFTLYDQDNALTNDPLLARSVKIDLAMEKDTFGAPLTLDNSIRVTLRNTF